MENDAHYMMVQYALLFNEAGFFNEKETTF